MISKDFVQNIFDRSITDLQTNNEYYVLVTTLPNGYVITVSSDSVENAVGLTKNKIYELESYLERDKVFYGYDLGNEFSEEN